MTAKTSYETDFFKWASDQSKLLKDGEYKKLDLQNLIEEIECLGRSERSMLSNYLEVLLVHMLKSKFQPEKHTRSWDLSMKHSNIKSNNVLKKNPSLKPQLKGILEETYECSILTAEKETGLSEKIFPEECPWELREIFPDLEEKYW